MNIHECCEEYAEGCVSCTMHEAIRNDERKIISALIAAEGPWCSSCKSHDYAISLAYEGSNANTVYKINPDAIDEDSLISVAYINITQEEINTPVKTVSVECNLDIDDLGNVIGIEILEWPKKKDPEENL